MKKLLVIIFVSIFILSCTLNESTKNLDVNSNANVRVVRIRDEKRNETTHEINQHNLLVGSFYESSYGARNSRTYVYDDSRSLSKVFTNNSVTGTEELTISTVLNRSTKQVVEKTKTYSSSRGQDSQFVIKYVYNENGDLVGMIQTDNYGNIIAKGVGN
jgi:hypothetical protein